MQRKDFRCTVIVRVNEGNVCSPSEGANDFQSHIDDLIKYFIRQMYLFLPPSLTFFSVLLLLFIVFFFFSSAAPTSMPFLIRSLCLSALPPFIQFSSYTLALTPNTFPLLNSFFLFVFARIVMRKIQFTRYVYACMCVYICENEKRATIQAIVVNR